MAHEETQKKSFGVGKIAKKTARYGARRKKKNTHCARRNQQNTRWALYEEIPKTRFFRCKNYGINCAFSLWNSKKTRFSKRTRIEAPFGARWIWIFFLCQYRGWRKQAKEARRLDKKSAHLEIVVRDVAPPGLLRTFSSSLGYQKSWDWAAGLRQNSWAKHQSETHNSWLWQVHVWICIHESIWICS